MVSSQTLQNFGQMFIMAFDGTYLPPEVAEFFRRFRIGGVILFADNYENPEQKFPGNKDSQAVYSERLDKIKAERLRRLLDSTKDVTITYGPTGAMSYQKAKEQELNLGLDLQGGMNVTLEVEMTGLGRATRVLGIGVLAALATPVRAQTVSNPGFELAGAEASRPRSWTTEGQGSYEIAWDSAVARRGWAQVAHPVLQFGPICS